MNRTNVFPVASASALGLLAALSACNLSMKAPTLDPGVADLPAAATPDGGGDPSAASAPDGGAVPGDDAAPGQDAGAPQPAAPWSATAPATPPTTLDVTGDDTCTFELGYVQENASLYSITLEKKDTTPGSCPDAKGFVYLTRNSYATPAGLVRRHSTDQLIAVAWNEKATPAGDAAVILRLAQIDWHTGANLHDGVMSVRGTPDVTPAPSLAPTSMNLSVGYDVILDGSGPFPGATGAGDGFEATFGAFLSTHPQAPSPADTATHM